MDRRQFCRTTVAAGVAAAYPFFPGCDRNTPTATQADTSIAAVSFTGSEIELERAAIKELGESLSGPVLLSGHPSYDSARKIWNGMHDKRPALIAQCTSTDDVVNTVTFASERSLLVAVKGGGHSFPGKSTCDGGMMIDLSLMHAVDVDVENRTARAGGGALLAHLDNATFEHNLATTTGVVSHTGVGGFTLGGGMGRTDRIFGLAIDNLLAAKVVTASGEMLTASADENPDLYWAIRGGGGNFGVATEFVYRVHPFNPTTYGGMLTYDFDQAKDVLNFYAEFSENLPDEASVEPQFFLGENGERIIAVVVCYTGDHDTGHKVMAPLREFGKPVAGELGPTSYHEMQISADGEMAHGRQYYLKSGFLRELTREAIDAMVDNYEGEHLPGIFFQHLGGASSRVAPNATAFIHRSVHSNFGIVAVWDDDALADKSIAAVRRYYAAVQPHMAGFYTNLNEDTEKKTWGNYGANYPRLVEIKNKYDPTNLFRLNANIRPTV